MKKACIISIGNELLNGQTVDTNANWLSREILTFGIPTEGIWVVGDTIERIVSCLKQASELADIILITGGLGPTDDDLTRQALAEFLGVELEFKQELFEEIEAFFKSRQFVMVPLNRVQAFIPAGSKAIPNARGTAPGIHAKKGQKEYFSVPGVPSEMKGMYESYIYPQLKQLQNGPIVLTRKVRCFGAGESTIAQMLGDMMKRGQNPLLNCTVSGGDITLHVVAEADSFPQAEQMILEQKRRISALLGSLVYSTEDKTLPEALGDKLKQAKKTLATAESCTGGLVSKLITDIPGSSQYYLGGWVTYSNEAKMRDLGVSKQLLDQYGAVSEPVARALAAGARHKAGSDAAIAITGIAGPDGGSEQKPVGLVYVAVQLGEQVEVREFRFPPQNREMVRLRAALSAINMLRLKLGVE
jgi:nicotinamide-nucleotide amidase